MDNNNLCTVWLEADMCICPVSFETEPTVSFFSMWSFFYYIPFLISRFTLLLWDLRGDFFAFLVQLEKNVNKLGL